MTEASASPQPPEIPDYELVQCIGQGSYGDVWLARTATGVYRAVKVVWRKRFPDAGPYEREFRGLREFEKVSLVQPRQLALLHVSRRDEEGFFYYVMELADDVVKGRDIEPETYQPFTLRELRRGGAMGAARVVDIGVELARGLAVLHDHGLVHRDIKPSNVVMVGGVPKLADIGLVAVSTMALTFVGTEGFVAPEGPGTPASDVYGLGKVLYELVTGLDRTVFPRLPDDFEQREDRVLFLELNAVVVRACEPDRAVRHEHARSLLDDLLLVQAGRSVRRLRAAERGLARALRTAAVLAVLASVAGAGAWVAWSRAQNEMALRADAEAQRDALARKTRYAGLLAQASRAISDQEFGLARQALRSAHEVVSGDELGPEWHWLQHASWGDAGTVLREPGAGIVRMALSPSQERLAVVDRDLVLTVYDLATNGVVGRLEAVGDLAGWGPDGRTIIGTDDRARAISWAWQTAGPAVIWETAAALATHAELTPLTVLENGTLLAVESRGAGRLVNLSRGGAAALFSPFGFGADPELGWQIFRHSVSPDKRWVAVAWVRGQGSAVEFRLTTGRVDGAGVLEIVPAVPPSSLGWESDALSGFRLEIVEELSGRRQWVDPGGSRAFGPASSLRAGSRATALEWGGAVMRSIGPELHVVHAGDAAVSWGHGGVVTQVLANQKTGYLISGAESGEIIRWNRERRIAPRQIGKSPVAVSSLRFAAAADGSRVFLPGAGGVNVLAADDGAKMDQWLDVGWVDIEVPGGLVGVDRTGRSVVMADRDSGAVTELTGATEAEVANIAASVDGRYLIYTRTDGSVWQHEAGTGDRQLELTPARRWSLNVDATGTMLWFTNPFMEVVAWDVRQGTQKWSTKLPAVVAHVVKLRSANRLVAAVTNGEVYVLDSETGAVVRNFASGSASAEFVTENEETHRIFIGGSDGRIHVYETLDWLNLATFRLPQKEALWFVKVARDGSRLFGLTRQGVLFSVAEN